MRKNKGNIKEQRKRYKLKYPEKIKAMKKEQYRRKHWLKPRPKGTSYQEKKKLWYEIIVQNNMHKCAVCGYDKCFGAIDFHHPKSSRDGKKELGGYILTLIPTPERIEKIKKCVPLCANCHRELHVNEKDMGKHKNQKKCAISESEYLRQRLLF